MLREQQACTGSSAFMSTGLTRGIVESASGAGMAVSKGPAGAKSEKALIWLNDAVSRYPKAASSSVMGALLEATELPDSTSPAT